MRGRRAAAGQPLGSRWAVGLGHRGVGRYHYVYASGREGDWFEVGFSPRKANLTLYGMGGFEGLEDVLSKLGKHATAKSCLYVRKLSDVDTAVLDQVVRAWVERVRSRE